MISHPGGQKDASATASEIIIFFVSHPGSNNGSGRNILTATAWKITSVDICVSFKVIISETDVQGTENARPK